MRKRKQKPFLPGFGSTLKVHGGVVTLTTYRSSFRRGLPRWSKVKTFTLTMGREETCQASA